MMDRDAVMLDALRQIATGRGITRSGGPRNLYRWEVYKIARDALLRIGEDWPAGDDQVDRLRHEAAE
jgi:hypothetical protein